MSTTIATESCRLPNIKFNSTNKYFQIHIKLCHGMNINGKALLKRFNLHKENNKNKKCL